MRIAVLGTGSVGRTLAARLAELGHDVTVGTRDPDATLARTDVDAMGNAPFREWADQHPSVTLETFAHAASAAEVVFHAANGEAAMEVLGFAGADNLAGKVLVDVANPLDFSTGVPPTLFVKDTDSLAERIQRAFPDARVVKTLNTMTAAVMVHPDALPEPSSVFVSGDDPAAKRTVTKILESFGHTDVIDLGDITSARGPEMMLPVWIRLYGALGTPMLNFKIVR